MTVKDDQIVYVIFEEYPQQVYAELSDLPFPPLGTIIQVKVVAIENGTTLFSFLDRPSEEYWLDWAGGRIIEPMEYLALAVKDAK